MQNFTLFFIIMLALTTTLELYLIFRQKRAIKNHRSEVPDAFSQKITLEDHQKAADYTTTKLNSGSLQLLYGSLLLLLWTLGGGLEWLDQGWRGVELSPIWIGVAVILSFSLLGTVLELPFSLWDTFHIEQKFGFNRTTLPLFFSDMGKQLLLSLLIGTPLLAFILWLMQGVDSLWWIKVWATWLGFSLFMLWAYPSWIAPLFNKFSPLEDKELVDRIESLMSRCGFASNGIFVMDGSRRSRHGNAYFSGLGSHKRIVFFDTLLEDLSPEEIEAVLAHELGHFRLKHVPKRLIQMALISFVALGLLGWLIEQPWFYQGLGISQPSNYMALILFMLVIPLVSPIFQPIMAAGSRKHEFEADAFASQQSNADDLINALVKLYQENANTLTPDSIYSSFHDSHPPAPVRIAHLQNLSTT